LDAADLAEEGTLNAADRLQLALQNEPAYPEELAEYTGIHIKTVRNTLSKLRKTGEVEPTGEREAGGSRQVRLVIPNPDPSKGDGNRDDEKTPEATPEHDV